MPIFEYTCRACGHRFETLVMGSRKPGCPQCGAVDLEKRHSSFGARASGSRGGGPATSRFT